MLSKYLSPKYYLLLPIVVVVLILPMLLVNYAHVLHILTMVALYSYLGMAWNILGGYAGQGSFCHAVFYGIGAYVAAVMFTWWGLTPYLAMVVAFILSALFAGGIGYVCFKFGLSGHFFFMASVAINTLMQIIFVNLGPTTAYGGAVGVEMPIIHGDSLYYLQFNRTRFLYFYYALALVIIALLISVKIKNHKIGYYLTAIKENEAGAEMSGVNSLKYKTLAFIISGGLTSLGGVFHAQYILFVDPFSVFDIMLSIDIVLVAVIGGIGVPYGPIIGASILQPIYEVIHSYFAFGYGYDRIIIGALLILIALFKPDGFADLIRKGYFNITKLISSK